MNTYTFPSNLPAIRRTRIQFDAINDAYWVFQHIAGPNSDRPCCSSQIIDDGILIQQYLSRKQAATRECNEVPAFTHLVIGSDAEVFNLGGDLALFLRCIQSGDRATLADYALRCVKAVAGFQDVAGDGSVHSIAVIQGDALGGGFEVALSCNTVIAEEGVQIGFPEVLFGLFPGMGAYSLLKRRISPNQARRMVLDGRMFSAEELHALGVIDIVAVRGSGMEVASNLVRQQRRAALAQRTVGKIYADYEAVSITELEDLTLRWVDAAMGITEKNLKTIERIVCAQQRRFNAIEVAGEVAEQRVR